MEPAQIRRLAVTGGNVRAGVALPVAPVNCRRIADELGGTCRSGVVRTASTPFSISWSRYQYFVAHGTNVRRIVMTVPTERPSLGEPAQQLAISTLSSSGPAGCFSSPASGISSLQSAAGSARLKVGNGSNSLLCRTSLRLQVSSGSSPIAQTGLFFGAPKSAVIHASGRAAEVVGSARGKIMHHNRSLHGQKHRKNGRPGLRDPR